MSDTQTPESEAMDEAIEIERAAKLLPAWFVPRMMQDEWWFAFLMVSGDIIHFTSITGVHLGADGVWIDIELAESIPWQGVPMEGRQIIAPTERTRASVNARHVQMAFETAYT